MEVFYKAIVIDKHIFPLACSAIHTSILFQCEVLSFGNSSCRDVFSNTIEQDCTCPVVLKVQIHLQTFQIS